MALEPGYERQVGGGTAVSLPNASAASFGADIGDNLQQLGGALERRHHVETQLAADQELADFNARSAAARAEADRWSTDARTNMQPGAAGHAKAAEDWWTARRDQLLTGITNGRVRRAAEHQLDEFGSRFGASEYQFEVGARVGKQTADTQAAIDVSANRARQLHDNKAYSEELSFQLQSIDALEGVPADVKQKLSKYAEESISVGFANGLQETNPKALVALVDTGIFNDLMSPAQIDQAKNGASIEIRRADAQAAHQQQLQAAALRDEVSTLKTQVSAGVQVPDAQLASAQSRLEALGDNSGATEIRVLRTEAGIRREADVWKPAQFDAEINTLAAKAKRSPAEDIRLATLRKMRPGAAATFNSNPGEWAAKNGMAPPALNLADPQSIAARKSWARTVSSAAGRPVPILMANEAADLRARAGESPKARLAVVDQIAAMGDYRSITSVARQIAPNDAMLARLATLPRDIRTASVAGAEVRQGNRTLIDGVAGTEAREAFDTRLGAAAQLMNPADLNAAFDTARNLYAYSTRDGAQAYEEGKFAPFIHQALGGTLGPRGERLGGVGRVNGAPLLLTPNMTQDRFDRAWSRFTFRQSDRTPVWQDGRAMTPVEVKRYQPTLRPDGRYEFHGPNNQILKVKSGGIWTVDFERFAQDVGL